MSTFLGFKFSLIGGKLATASSLLLLLADHLGIDPEIFGEVCALWMVSDLLEVQLKPHHNPYDIRKNWLQFLSRFTSVDEDEASDDEPLLMLKRNVQLSVEREVQVLEKDYANDTLTEILYTSAKQEVLDGRYLCDIDVSINLAALQMAVEIEPGEDVHQLLLGDQLAMYFPSKHRHCVRSVCFFGFPVIGCKGLEAKIQQEYNDTKLKFESKHACRKAYLEIVRETPFYGFVQRKLTFFRAAFFRGHVERPRGTSLKEIKKMILSVTLPDIPVIFVPFLKFENL
ncbi:unnamed protein product [Gongylonema pulchrum]|uniref:FERM domain-containing protein 8 n=1 Tax=Gongylonema pulchrum TaxID=637853 RepID=A0A183D2Q0_9BILA|nr:unnamed protein product [Gongylonema pulchrum]